jgi:4-aminobutyrate aminotransferase-like enzyme
LAGVELRRASGSPAAVESINTIKAMLQRGFVLLPEGEHGNVISFTPPLTISESQLAGAVRELQNVLSRG